MQYKLRLQTVVRTRLGLQCQTPASYLYLIKTFGLLFPQNIVVLKNFWSKKNLLAPQKFFDPKKFLGPKKILCLKKNVWSKKQIMAENQFSVEISFWLLNIFRQNILVKKIFG